MRQKSLRRNGIALIVNKSLKCSTWVQSQKTTEWSLFVSKANHSISQYSKSIPYPLMSRKLRWNDSMQAYKTCYNKKKKRFFFHHRGLEAKVGSKETPGLTGKFGLGIQNEAGQRLIEFCQENELVITNTLFHNTREDSIHASPDGQHWNQIDYVLCSQRI